MLRHTLLWLLLMPGCNAPSPRPPEDERIVALTPSLASALIAIEPTAHLVGTTQYTDWPESARRVATLPMPTPPEQVLALRPTLVLAHPASLQLIAKLESLHIPVFAHAMDTLPDIFETLQNLGHALHVPQKGLLAAQRLQAELDAVTQGHKEAPAVRLLFIIDVADARMQQFYTAQNDAYLAALSQNCGGQTLAADTSRWGRITAESLIRLDPPAILFLSPDETTGNERRRMFADLYPTLRAVKEGRVYFLNGASYSIPDTRLPQTQAAICLAIDTLRFAKSSGDASPCAAIGAAY